MNLPELLDTVLGDHAVLEVRFERSGPQRWAWVVDRFGRSHVAGSYRGFVEALTKALERRARRQQNEAEGMEDTRRVSVETEEERISRIDAQTMLRKWEPEEKKEA